MREIKFRAWDIDNKEMCDIGIIDIDDGSVEGNRFSGGAASLFLGEFVLMQYTGLKDKNGIEIYEGDIIKGVSQGVCYEVVWQAPSFVMKRTANKYWYEFIRKDSENQFEEVIGNIHEHKHLLESNNGS